MSHELLHMFKHAQRQCSCHGGTVVEEFRKGSTKFQVVEQRPYRYTGTDEDRRAAENVRI